MGESKNKIRKNVFIFFALIYDVSPFPSLQIVKKKTKGKLQQKKDSFKKNALLRKREKVNVNFISFFSTLRPNV